MGVQDELLQAAAALLQVELLGEQVVAVGQGAARGLALGVEVGLQDGDGLGRQVGRGGDTGAAFAAGEPAFGRFQELGDARGEEGLAGVVLGAPERRRTTARVGADEDVVGVDGLNTPGLRAEHEPVADRALEDILLVEFAQPCAATLDAQGEVAAIGDRAALGRQVAEGLGVGGGGLGQAVNV